MNIRKATQDDAQSLFQIGLDSPELTVSSVEVFMDEAEFRWAIDDSNGIFLVAEEDEKPIGFLYANSRDKELPFRETWACVVYIVVLPEYRGRGVATKLYQTSEIKMKEMGITHVYVWANIDSGVIDFMEKQEFVKGHTYVWMDKKLS